MPQEERSHTFLYIVIAFIACLSLILYKVLGPNTGALTKGEYLYVHTHSKYPQLLESLEEGGYIKDMWSFKIFAWQSQMRTHVHPGKYHIKKGMSNYSIIRMLRAGRQTPVKLVINKLRTKHDFINLISSNLECDSGQVSQLLQNRGYLSQFGLDTGTVIGGIMPDTYDFFWNINADHAFRKIEKNYARFWNKARVDKASAKGLDQMQAITIASIVEEETNVNDDKPFIASVYINRLNKGMKLQADPTVKYAIGDFTIKRVAGDMLKTNSPYNTYMYEGVPPGPICTPSLSSINAVLDAPETNYLYFCAKADFSGGSAFATSLEQQMKNAKEYQKALNERGIH